MNWFLRAMTERSISFPDDEIPGLKAEFEKGRAFYTTRISDEQGKYREGDVLLTPWGDRAIVVEVRTFTDIKDHPFYDELRPDWVEQIEGREVPAFDHVKLEKYH